MVMVEPSAVVWRRASTGTPSVAHSPALQTALGALGGGTGGGRGGVHHHNYRYEASVWIYSPPELAEPDGNPASEAVLLPWSYSCSLLLP